MRYPFCPNFWCRGKKCFERKSLMHQATKKSPRSSVYPTREEPLHHAILSKFLVDKKCFLPSICLVVREKELGNKQRRRALGEPDTEAPLLHLHAILSKFLVGKHPSKHLKSWAKAADRLQLQLRGAHNFSHRNINTSILHHLGGALHSIIPNYTHTRLIAVVTITLISSLSCASH